MAIHKVKISLPEAELGKKDALFEIFQNNKKLGTITISKGAIEWYRANAKSPIKLSWSQFNRLMQTKA